MQEIPLSPRIVKKDMIDTASFATNITTDTITFEELSIDSNVSSCFTYNLL